MSKQIAITLLCGIVLVGPLTAQEVMIMRDSKPKAAKQESVAQDRARLQKALETKSDFHIEKATPVQSVNAPIVQTQPGVARPVIVHAQRQPTTTPATAKSGGQSPSTIATSPASAQSTKVGSGVSAPATQQPRQAQLAKPANQSALTIATAPPTVQIQKPSAAPAVAGSQQPRPVQPTKPESQSAVTIATTPATVQAHKPPPAVAAPVTPQTRQASSSAKPESPSARTIAAPPAKMEMHKPEAQIAASSSSPAQPDRADEAVQKMNLQGATAFTRLANGFDFPVGKPDAKNYYKARGFRSHGHMGEDWDGIRGGDTDLNDPVYCIGDGVVVFARDCHQGWGNVIIVRHAFREGGTVKNIDSLYGHVQKMMVRKGDAVTRGQQIATIGNAHGLYDAHLHLEIRKNLEIGMSRAAFARDFGNYYDPTEFILSHRVLNTKGGTYRIAMNTFTHDKYIKWDKKKNFSNYRGGTGESARALKKALASQSVGGSR